jgi:endoglucanase
MIFATPLEPLLGQGFLHTQGKNIVNGAGENVILRGIGTGNWMLQEGYMMKSEGIAGTQHEFMGRLVNTIGEARTDSFYTVWLDSHFTRTDVDSMASWGFNSVRVAMHYKWFTLPIEEEPVPGGNTWLEKGFAIIDSLLDWCGDNGMYLILDLHGAPGGQGENADISDYDPSKPSLWESQQNRDKTVALWKKLAERYSQEPWIGGYDLINETNWPLGNVNLALKQLYLQITDSIRTVDSNHIIFIEGNGFANDFRGLTPRWDDNMVYSFHKYWSYNRAGSLDWVTQMRDQYNVPVWLGESGENSNTWFTNLISLCETQNIGWSWWPVKKDRMDNVLKVEVNDDYLQLIENWKGNGPMLSADEAFQAVLTFAERQRIENCEVGRDVIDALLRQPHTSGTIPFGDHAAGEVVFTSDYDLGRNGHAYSDQDTADYHGDTGEFGNWNQGWTYRNDGVDIEPCQDALTNGTNVGWTAKDEWLAYTLRVDTAAAYDMEIRSAASSGGSKIHVEVNGVDATGTVQLPVTGGWQSWTTSHLEDIILPEGTVQLKICFESGGSNLNWFRLSGAEPDSALPFTIVSAQTLVLGNEVYISLNKPVSTPDFPDASEFSLLQDGSAVLIDSVRVSPEDARVLILYTSAVLFYDRSIRISYSGSGIRHGEQELVPFDSEPVQNLLARHFTVPSRIQAEAFFRNNGLELESCSDVGGGQNTGYANRGDYLDYVLYVEQSGTYVLDFRVASDYSGGALAMQVDRGQGFKTIGNVSFPRTGGWQTWTTQSVPVSLEQGKYVFRLLVTGNEHNLNWFQFRIPVSVRPVPADEPFRIYPNPASGHITVVAGSSDSDPLVEVWDSLGRKVFKQQLTGGYGEIDVSSWTEGIYFVRTMENSREKVFKLMVKR